MTRRTRPPRGVQSAMVVVAVAAVLLAAMVVIDRGGSAGIGVSALPGATGQPPTGPTGGGSGGSGGPPFPLEPPGMPSGPGASATAAPPAPGYAHIPGQFPVPATTTSQGDTQAPVGGCGNVEGIGEQSRLTIIDCSKPHAYIVIQRVSTPPECVEDADRYLHLRDGAVQWTACLDLAWDNTGCISLGMEISKVACDNASAINRFKATNLLLNTTTVQGCPDGGYAHPIRRFTICSKLVG